MTVSRRFSRLSFPSLLFFFSALFLVTHAVSDPKEKEEAPAKAIPVDAKGAHGKADHKPVCLFLHSAGVQKPSENKTIVTDTQSFIWGNVHEKVKEFCKPRFIHADTETRGWDSDELVSEYCKAIVDEKARIVFTHGAGGLALANGVLHKKPGCDKVKKHKEPLGKDGIAWVSIQGPFFGSPVADFCLQICRLRMLDNGEPDLVGWLKIIQGVRSPDKMMKYIKKRKLAPQLKLSKTFCGCPSGDAPRPSMFALSTGYSSRTGISFSKLEHVQRMRARRIMCGIGSAPLSGKPIQNAFQPTPHQLGGFIDWGKDDEKQNFRSPYSGRDGFVGFRSCRGSLGGEQFKMKPTAQYYVARLSHADGTGLEGDGGDAKPLVFYADAAEQLAHEVEGKLDAPRVTKDKQEEKTKEDKDRKPIRVEDTHDPRDRAADDHGDRRDRDRRDSRDPRDPRDNRDPRDRRDPYPPDRRDPMDHRDGPRDRDRSDPRGLPPPLAGSPFPDSRRR